MTRQGVREPVRPLLAAAAGVLLLLTAGELAGQEVPVEEPPAESAAPQTLPSGRAQHDEFREDVLGEDALDEGEDLEVPSKRFTVTLRDGLDYRGPNGNNSVHAELRTQLRYSDPFDGEPRTLGDLELGQDAGAKLGLNRGRIKVGGHVFRPWLEYYTEYDFAAPYLLDLRLTLTSRDALQLRVGQWKAEYSRERIDSSGKQQLVDRSIVNREFTIDRQGGLELMGRLGKGSRFDWQYWAGVFTGGGRGGANDDDHPMVMGRWQWNFQGGGVPFSQSDLAREPKPRGSFALAAVTNRSRYTRFSSEGGGQLDGFEPVEDGQYRVNQAMEEVAWRWRGLSLQHEGHWKQIDDRVTGEVTELTGAYVAFGAFLSEWWRIVPQPLEVALRWATVDPDNREQGDRRNEITLGCNWFFDVHRNKLTFDVSRIRFKTEMGDRDSELRVRLQWDVSF